MLAQPAFGLPRFCGNVLRALLHTRGQRFGGAGLFGSEVEQGFGIGREQDLLFALQQGDEILQRGMFFLEAGLDSGSAQR